MIAAVGEEAFEGVRALAPPGVEVRLLGRDPVDGVTFLVPGWSDDVDVREFPDVQVMQVLSAGTDWIEDDLPPGVVLCNARGARDVPVAEWVVGALLGATTGLLRVAREHGTQGYKDFRPDELAGTRVVILGMGSIGQAVRRRLEALRVEVVGVARTARPGISPVEELDTVLGDAGALVVLTPLTDETRGLVGTEVLAALPDGALVLNAGRGAVVDTDALVAELQAPRLRAVLDVVEPEPLPPGHPLWNAPGLLALTPHTAGDSVGGDRRAARFAGEQLGRFARGEPLRNVVRGAAIA